MDLIRRITESGSEGGGGDNYNLQFDAGSRTSI